MEQPDTITNYELMFSNALLKRLPMSTRCILLRYYAETAIVAVLAGLEKKGVMPETLGFLEALDEFERQGVPRIANLASWLTVRKRTCSKEY